MKLENIMVYRIKHLEKENDKLIKHNQLISIESMRKDFKIIRLKNILAAEIGEHKTEYLIERINNDL